MKNSAIEWTDHTFNPWEGCTKVSPGCAHCYAEARNRRFAGGANWGPGAPRRRTSAQNWKQPLRWNVAAEEDQRAAYQANQPVPARPRVFCASLADWLDDEVPLEWLADLLDLIQSTSHLDWLLLTKRPQNWRPRIEAVWASLLGDRRSLADQWLAGRAPANVWIGTTTEDQPRSDERIPHLLRIPARVRFLSCEPLLGPVEFSDVTKRADCRALQGIHWVICGGESGAGARPMHPAWARSLRDQCAGAAVPFFFKQWGEHNERGARVGKIAAGRLLDGLEHNALPSPAT